MTTIPPFDSDGLLPPGDYEVSFEEVRQSILVVEPDGPSRSPTWDAPWRAKLVDNLEILTRQLWQVGVTWFSPTDHSRKTRTIPTTLTGISFADSMR